MTTGGKWLRYAMLHASLIALAACASQPLHVPKPENVPYEETRGHEISQRACGFMLGGALPIGMSDRYQRGYDALMAQARNEYVTDVKVQEVLRYAFVGWRYCAMFTAMAYERPTR